jgi:LysR family transcriptional regulator, carnitine catabolism transcriptional activator
MVDFTSRQLRAFLLVAQHHNFTRAAEALFITPSGLSLLIRELERQLGFRLFDRTTRHVALTPQGRRLLAVARRSLEELDGAVSRIGQIARQAGDTLSVGAGLLVAANVLPQAIHEFRTPRPELRIQLFDADPATILQRVRAGALDMGLGSFKNTPGVRRTLFFTFSLMVIRRDHHTVPRRTSTTWSALKGERLLLPSPMRSLIDQHLAHAGVTSRPAMVLNRFDTLIAMVEAGEGTGIVPSSALPVCQRRHVVMSRLINPTVPVEFYQILNRGRELSPVAKEFTTFLQSYIAGWAGRAGVPYIDSRFCRNSTPIRQRDGGPHRLPLMAIRYPASSVAHHGRLRKVSVDDHLIGPLP